MEDLFKKYANERKERLLNDLMMHYNHGTLTIEKTHGIVSAIFEMRLLEREKERMISEREAAEANKVARREPADQEL